MAVRCKKHGLGAGPDGCCVLCHREARQSLRVEKTYASVNWARLGVPLGALGVLAVVVTVWHRSQEPASTPRELEAQAVTLLPVEPSPNSQETPKAALQAPHEPPKVSKDADLAVPSGVPPIREPGVNGVGSSSEPRETRQPSPTVSSRQLERTISAIPIKVFETAWCPHCRRAKAWFNTQTLTVTAYDVDRDAQAKQEMKRYNPQGGVPTILVGDRVLVGFSENQVTQTLAAVASERLSVTVKAVRN